MNYSHWCIDATTTLDWISSHLHVINSASDHHISNCPKAVGDPFSVRTQRGWQQDLRSQKTLTLMSDAKHMDIRIFQKKLPKMDPKSQDANVIQSQCQFCVRGRFENDFHPCHQHIIAPWASQQSVGVSQCDLHLPNLWHAGMRFSDGHRIEKFLRIGIVFSLTATVAGWKNRGIPKWKQKPMELKLQKTCLDPGHSWARESSFARQN